jgi:hypothetical protein
MGVVVETTPPTSARGLKRVGSRFRLRGRAQVGPRGRALFEGAFPPCSQAADDDGFNRCYSPCRKRVSLLPPTAASATARNALQPVVHRGALAASDIAALVECFVAPRSVVVARTWTPSTRSKRRSSASETLDEDRILRSLLHSCSPLLGVVPARSRRRAARVSLSLTRRIPDAPPAPLFEIFFYPPPSQGVPAPESVRVASLVGPAGRPAHRILGG